MFDVYIMKIAELKQQCAAESIAYLADTLMA